MYHTICHMPYTIYISPLPLPLPLHHLPSLPSLISLTSLTSLLNLLTTLSLASTPGRSLSLPPIPGARNPFLAASLRAEVWFQKAQLCPLCMCMGFERSDSGEGEEVSSEKTSGFTGSIDVGGVGVGVGWDLELE